ncbi:hypothetical protein EV356DRAFT_510033 [Viridothelium virens]|uniref:Uncharacterized protein n=1 Tax=Viridothelium virens TaxID=1048519 RepID=A0A6A6GVV6_VIRVR|nr:hypothetical protein EV356DRAFT_510033 [Viridothelium virens]
MSNTNPMELPHNPSSWGKAISENNLLGKTIFDLENSKSGSAIEYKQFLLLRTLWTQQLREDFSSRADIRAKWFTASSESKADDMLLKDVKVSKMWKRYLLSFQGGHRGANAVEDPDLGTFSLVRYYQQAVLGLTSSNESQKTQYYYTRSAAKSIQASRGNPQTPTPAEKGGLSSTLGRLDINAVESPPWPSAESRMSSYSLQARETALPLAPTEDEQIVNTALILFLTAVTMHFTGKVDWTLERRAFRVRRREGKEKIFEARVDGILRQRSNTNSVLAIVEVKPFERHKYSPIRMQEAAQMAAWICESSGTSMDNPNTTSQAGLQRYVTECLDYRTYTKA